MDQALDQARQGIGLASPNPTVGCVIVKDGLLLGKGYHIYENRDHAEIVALRNAGPRSLGATAYVTLEPCSHYGRTGPCANALVTAGIARVVVATTDPNLDINGRGLAILQGAGIEIKLGVRRIEAQRLNDAFARFIRTGHPLVTLKAGLSLDGRIAPAFGVAPLGDPYWISGEESRAEVHRMRHAADAILLGINSVLIDDPLLTDRSKLPRRRPLMRAILDSQLRIPLDSRLVCSAAEDLVVFCTTRGSGDKQARVHERIQALEDRGVQVVELGSDLHVPLTGALNWFASQKRTSILLEGGSTIITQALREDLVDKISLFYAPKILGGEAVPLLGDLTGHKVEMQDVQVSRFGEDIRVEAVVRDPWKL